MTLQFAIIQIGITKLDISSHWLLTDSVISIQDFNGLYGQYVNSRLQGVRIQEQEHVV